MKVLRRLVLLVLPAVVVAILFAADFRREETVQAQAGTTHTNLAR